MKVENQTNYSTKAIRKIVALVHNDLKKTVGKPYLHWGSLTILAYHRADDDFRKARKKILSATSVFAGNGAVIELPLRSARPLADRIAERLQGHNPQEPAVISEVAYHVWWRLMGLYGFGNRRPVNVGFKTFAWVAREFETDILPFKEEVPVKPKAPVQVQRYKRLLELEVQWQRKAKLAHTKLRKIKVKKRYYEKQGIDQPLLTEESKLA